MKSILILLIITCLSFTSGKNEYTFFRIDENIKLEDIQFDKEIERWNRTIKVENTKSFNFNLNVNGNKQNFKLNRNSILSLNSITLKENKNKENSIEINRGHTIVKYTENKNLDYTIVINCFSMVEDRGSFKTNSEVFDRDIISNPSFFFQE